MGYRYIHVIVHGYTYWMQNLIREGFNHQRLIIETYNGSLSTTQKL